MSFRMHRICKGGRFLIIPMDHGFTIGPVTGLIDINKTVEAVSSGGATAILGHKGFLQSIDPEIIEPTTGIILHMSGSTSFGPDPNSKVLIASLDDAFRLGVDGISVHVNVGGSDYEPKMLSDLGQIATESQQYNIPLMAMMYARGSNIVNSFDAKVIAHAARIGAELGVDIIKCNYTGDSETFRDVVRGCPKPIVIAGGPKMDNSSELINMVCGAMEAGAAGISIGRNIFQHDDPKLITQTMAKIIFENYSLQKATSFYESHVNKIV
ncbi:MAG: 2-amino-3,7-dideoxy-D-threo-hept-6-ulosonate synthase [Promethearchaeota archaeon]